MIHLHNFLRWVVLVAGIIAVVRAHLALTGDRPWHKVPGLVFVTSLHLQLLLGLVLYFGVSGVTAAFLADPGGAMKVTALRFFGVEHATLMLAAVVVATIGSAKARRAPDEAAKNKATRTFFAIALLLLVLGIPWPFRGDGVGRGWFPGMPAPAAPVPATTAPASPAAG